VDFFSAQARAQTKTRWLAVFFALAVFGTGTAAYFAIASALTFTGLFHLEREPSANVVRQTHHSIVSFLYAHNFWNVRYALIAQGVVAIVVAGGSLYKWASLREGGAAIAEMMGGRPVSPYTTDLAERQFLNVVEEMAIAAGMSVPAAYVLPREGTINAFAAGLTTDDAVVAITQGALIQFTREELQAVVGHEFSHILNGDMRLNIKLAALLFGILSIAAIGRRAIYVSSRIRHGEGKNSGAAAIPIIFMLGLSLLAIGHVGHLFGRLIQTAISRQREFLADASSAQFTRNPAAMAAALNKIRARSSIVADPHASEFSHVFFAQCDPFYSLVHWFDTHPPLEKRITTLVPDFDLTAPPPRYKKIAPEYSSVPSPDDDDGTDESPLIPTFAAISAAVGAAAAPPATTAAALVASIGAVASDQLRQAQTLLDELPDALRTAARDPATAPALIFGLLLDAAPAVRAKQRATLDAAGAVAPAPALLAELDALHPLQRLPLLQIALGALNGLSPAQQDRLLDISRRLVAADLRTSIFEYALLRLLRHHLDSLRNPRRAAHVVQIETSALLEPIGAILSFIAYAGQPLTGKSAAAVASDADAAFATGAATLPAALWRNVSLLPKTECYFNRLDNALASLSVVPPAIKQQVLAAAAQTAAADGIIQPEEAELLRAIACSLDCPMPLVPQIYNPDSHIP
jgi:Zn-dependent protease with chaperone function